MFINPRCIFPSRILLEDKQKFKHGGVMSAIFAWIYWVFRSHFRGLK